MDPQGRLGVTASPHGIFAPPSSVTPDPQEALLDTFHAGADQHDTHRWSKHGSSTGRVWGGTNPLWVTR